MDFEPGISKSTDRKRPTTYTFDDNDKSWFLHFEQPDPGKEKEAIAGQFKDGVFLPPDPFVKQEQKPGICPKFLCGMCLHGGLCPYRHEFIDDSKDEDAAIKDDPFFPCIITKSQILQNIENIEKLKGLYVVLLSGISLQTGGLCQQIMRVDEVVKDCFSPGKLGSPYGLTLSVEGNEQTEVVVRINQLADNFNKREMRMLVDKYLSTVRKITGNSFDSENLAALTNNIHYFRLKTN